MDRFEKGFTAFAIVAVIGNILFWAAIAFVAIHFLGKVW